MFCTDISADSNCLKISLGHGIPGMIVELPQGCGPSEYAVAKPLTMSKTQDPTILKRLEKRGYGHVPLIYDFAFEFHSERVPRDLGDNQMRVDYSNQVGYWHTIMNKAAF